MSRLPAIWNGWRNSRRPALVGGFGDEEHRVLALDHRLAENLHPVAPHVGPAQVVQEHRAHVGVLRRTALAGMVVPDYEQRHARSRTRRGDVSIPADRHLSLRSG